MAAETTTTSLTELIPPERIEELIGMENRAAAPHDLIAWLKDMSDQPANQLAIPRYDKTDVPSGTKAEAAEFSNVEQTASEATISWGDVGLARELTDVAGQLARQQAEDMFMLNLRAMRERVSSDILGLITSASNTSDFSTTNLDLDKWGTATAAFSAQLPYAGFMRVAVLSTNQLRDLKKAVRNAGGTIEATGRGLGLLETQGDGSIYSFEGYTIIESALVPNFDVSNDSGALIIVGRDSMRTWSTFVWAVWKGITNEIERHAKKLTNDLVTSARYGVGITNQANLREIVSKKAA